MGNICSMLSLQLYKNEVNNDISIDYYHPILITLENGNIEEYYNYSPINTS
jgi:hypothetical protein